VARARRESGKRPATRLADGSGSTIEAVLPAG